MLVYANKFSKRLPVLFGLGCSSGRRRARGQRLQRQGTVSPVSQAHVPWFRQVIEVEAVRYRPLLFPLILVVIGASGGCATIRTTDPSRTATEQFLMSEAAARAVDQLKNEALRDRKVYLDATYMNASTLSQEQSFLLGELRARLLLGGVRLVPKREDAQIIMEVRSGGLSIDRLEFLLGVPAVYLAGGASPTPGNLPVATPELAIFKTTRQKGFAAVAYVAYWADTGEVVANSGPFVGRTFREDLWIFGAGPRTTGNIPTTK